MKAPLKYILFAAWMLALGCTQEQQLLEENFVVEAFLFTGEPVNNITIKQIQPLTGGSSEPVLIKDAEVTITKNQISYDLTYVDSTGRYAYPGTDLIVNTGDRFALQVVKGNRVANAETVVPEPASGVTVSSDTLVIPIIQIRLGIAEELTKLFNTGRVTVSWSNAENQLHFVVVENVVEGDLIFPADFPIPKQTLALVQSFRYISAPTTDTSFEVPGLSLDTYGTYRAKVYRVNQEYADLYNSQVQDSRDLNEPPSNIRNALGIFSAFASDAVTFEVTKN